MAGERQYLGTTAFADLVKRAKAGADATLDVTKLAIISGMKSVAKALGGPDSRLIEFTITSDRVDRDQDILNPQGWETDDYKNNPVVLWAHDHSMPPIGNSRSLSQQSNTLTSICEFTPPELCDGFGYMIYQMYAAAFMHAVSVGFMPIEYTYSEDRKYGINYLKQSLLEYSAVPVPSNPDALALARGKGVNTLPLKRWAERVLDENNSGDATLAVDARRRLELLRSAASPSGRALILEISSLTDDSRTVETIMKKDERVSKLRDLRISETGVTDASQLAEVRHINAMVGSLADSYDRLAKARNAEDLPDPPAVSVGDAVKIVTDGKAQLTPEHVASLKTAVASDAPAVEDDGAGDGVFVTEAGPGEEGHLIELDETTLVDAVRSSVEGALGKAMGRVE
jgi:hypothetical protein